jgi:hypothetical protein
MKNRWLTSTMLVLAAAASVALVDLGWQRLLSFFGLLIASIAGVVLVTFVFRNQVADWPRPSGPHSEPDGQNEPPSALGMGLGMAGLWFIGVALWLALIDRLSWTLACVIGAAACWKPVISMSNGRRFTRREVAILMGLVMALGVLFRFYKVGDIPTGLITVDEPRLIAYAHELLDGKRITFHEGYGEGYAPIWVEAAAMWLFGRDITGFRMSAAIPGLIVVGLMGLLVLELHGMSLGLLAAACTAVCVWPVAFSRSEYLVSTTLVPMLAAPWLLLFGLRRGLPWAHVLSGFFLGICFNIYTPARFAVVMFIFLWGMLWLRRPAWRPALRASFLPLVGGLVVGLAPLILWVAKDPNLAYRSYFGKLNMDFIAGQDVIQSPTLLGKLDSMFGRVLPNLPRLLTMFTINGGMRPWYFKLNQPVIDHATLFLLLAGLAVSLVRFRQVAYMFMVTWWLVGLVPALLANPQFHMDERRIMMSMPAVMFLAAAGLHDLTSLVTRWWSDPFRKWLAFFVVFFAVSALAVSSWRSYFHDIEMDRQRQDHNRANFDNMIRAIFRQDHKGPVTVLSFRKPNDDSWWGANFENDLVEHWQVLHTVPARLAAADTAYFAKGGLFGSLREMLNANKDRDPLIVLTPFHFYLEPLLVGQLGGVRVEDVSPVMALDGPNFKNVGYAWDPKIATRLIRLHGLEAARLESLATRWSYDYSTEELEPPRSLGDRDTLSNLFLLDPAHIQALKDYDADPTRWRANRDRAGRFALTDPWFWVTANNLPGKSRMPMRLKAHWKLRIPADGEYAFGASSTYYLVIKIDGKKVFTYLPETREQHEAAREGYLGQPVYLKAGEYDFEFEQVALSSNGNFNQLIRLLWQPQGRDKATLPLEAIAPLETPEG